MADAKAPIDVVGTGSFIPDAWHETYATADIVEYDGVPMVKVGREFLLRKNAAGGSRAAEPARQVDFANFRPITSVMRVAGAQQQQCPAWQCREKGRWPISFVPRRVATC